MRQLQLFDSYQRPWSKTVLSKDCAVQKSEAAKFLELTFHGQWHIFRVRLQPLSLCSGSFVCLGSNRSLANRVDATVEVVLARSQNCPPKLRPDL